ncbi:protein NRT1/ PTR FAMILY 8.4 isoform X1 [Eutrema salsugineum]|uniref:protein NRT1/ PTR FAMILY 8.4 isoform X1 n=1 Tax=Eutrema salsugineum TaxID=72664 RepID=UPI000CED66C7|nr:protein NRT1/ PTR FAMILY 8.4 isoform X1 [Eutrema salsugineum]
MGSIDEERSLLEVEESLLQEEVNLYAEDGSIDINGNPPLKQKTGNWKACPFIFANECCERLAYYGIAKNLITYFTNELHETNVSAARHVMTWQGTCYITPLIGALIADAYWGRYWTIACFSAIYFTGMVALTLSASVPGLKPAECIGSICPPATMAQQVVLFSGLYLIALGTGGIKPCVSSFGADQFDQTDPSERVRKASFFNWFYFSINIGAFVSSTLLVWVQENCGWELGFMIPTVFMGLATLSFFFGTPLYRFQRPRGSPITRACQVLVASYRKSNLKVLEEDQKVLFETTDKNSSVAAMRKIQHTDGYKCLDKAAIISEDDAKSGTIHDPWKLCTVTQVEEVKILLRLFPIWASGIVFSVLHSQIYTLFVQQGRSMKRTIVSFEIPPATLGMFDTASVLISVPIYDRLIVPFVRRFTGLPKGFTDLQRMGIGLLVSVLSLTVAAIVETMRLRLARDLDLVESGDTVPLTIFLQIPQYFLMGTAGVFFFVGRIQFFYEQSPESMRSLCSAWALLTTTLGNYLSSVIITVVAYLSGKDDGGWIPSDNINKGHLDYFFWLLVCLGCVNIPVFVFFSVKYTHKKV